ncbi:PLD nuclease N-terminal domain-containing protein [Nocardiopsis sp. CT-R113]|uniref:PLD nuclease N-terminal domain-containing protein n=1 Tax=Nocardiopsis codii TaxID=3065942 RepID=A0ABU7K677_9ACTN|nr:PLD nuclease N-terminal domain-containing protein [Nocardiopsis sp. CT-R113]MEE2037689.1 PLD nuclease N-terminal domain-containing protein [Nocardiopsis sp. CT-R113]
MSLLTLADSTTMQTGIAAAILIMALLAGLAVVVFIIAAVFSIIGSPVDGSMKVVWLIFVIIAPLIGAVLWFLVGRGQGYRYR